MEVIVIGGITAYWNDIINPRIIPLNRTNGRYPLCSNNKNIEFNSVPVEVTKNNNKFTVKTEYGTHDADIVISSTGIIPDAPVVITSLS